MEKEKWRKTDKVWLQSIIKLKRKKKIEKTAMKIV